MIKPLSILFSILFSVATFCQVQDSDLLFTVENEQVTAKEFLRVYNKNLDLVKDETQKDVDAYLQLYINYQLKLQEAKRLGLQNDINYQREFTTYKNQLIKNFLSDNKVTEELVREAYDRLSKDVKAVHILLMVDEADPDTTAVYNRLVELKERLKNEDFEQLRSELHDGKDVFVEDLGYFTGFKMVYPFETAAYNTKIGEVSKPFRTRFGFHIVKVLDKRDSRGEVTVEHIMIGNNQADSTVLPKQRIDEIYLMLKQGEDFESLAKQFSDDKGTADKGGLMAPFQGGQLSSMEFENAAFDIEKVGEISKPFKTDFGWHIVKLIEKKPFRSFEEMKPELEMKVKRDSRSNLIDSALLNDIRIKYLIKKYDEQIQYFKSILNDDYLKRAWRLPEDFKKDAVIASIDDKNITNEDFGNFLLGNQTRFNGKQIDVKEIVDFEFSKFLDEQILSYHENNLENINEDFAFVLQEYRDGLLLFDLMEKEIWNAAIKDSVGIQEFYDKNKDNYKSAESFEGTIMTSSNKTDLEKAMMELKKGKSVEDINKEMNTQSSQKVILTQGEFERGHQLVPDDFKFKTGISKIYGNLGSFSFFKVDEILPSRIKELEEAKGRVISDYQTYLEEEWIKKLKERYKVDVHDDVLSYVKTKLSSQSE